MQCDWTASQSANLCNSWQIVKSGLRPALIAGLDMSWVPQQRCCVWVAGCPSNSSGCHSGVVVCGSLSVPAVAATAELLQRSYCLFPQQSCCLWVTECPSSGCCSRVVVCGSLSVPAVAAAAELLFVDHWVSQQWLLQQSCCLWVTECPSSGCCSKVVVCGSLSVLAVAAAAELLFVGHWVSQQWLLQQSCCLWVTECPSSGCCSRVVVCGSLSVPAVAATAELLFVGHWVSQQWLPQQSCCLWVTECPSSGCHRVVVCGSLSVPAVAATAELLFVGHWVSQQWLPQQSCCLWVTVSQEWLPQSCCLWVTECPSSGCHSRVVVCGSLSVPAVAATAELLFVGHWVSQQWLPQSCCLWVTECPSSGCHSRVVVCGSLSVPAVAATAELLFVGHSVPGVAATELLFVGRWVSQQQQAVSQWQIWSDSHFCGHTEREIADQTSCFTQSVYTDNRPTGPRIDTVKCNARFLEFLDTGMTYSWKAEIDSCVWLTLGKRRFISVCDLLLESRHCFLCMTYSWTVEIDTCVSCSWLGWLATWMLRLSSRRKIVQCGGACCLPVTWTGLGNSHPVSWCDWIQPGAGVMEADNCQVTTVFTVQPPFHHRHSTNRVSWRVTIVGERCGEVWLHVRWWW